MNETEQGGAPHDGAGNDATSTEPQASGGYHWHLMVVVSAVVMGFLALSLWRRMSQVDPVARCAYAYHSSYTPLDTTLVDRIKVRSPDGNGKTTCEVLRRNGSVDRIPRAGKPRSRMP